MTLQADDHRVYVAENLEKRDAEISDEPRAGGLRIVRPFFGFYGGKWRDTLKHYPPPKHDTIVEPFAGSAGYALRYYRHNVILCEIDEILAAVWSYLIRVSPNEIRRIPDLSDGQAVSDLRICEEAQWLVGFWMNRGASRPRQSPSKWMREGIRPGSFWGQRVRETIASQVDLIRHWKIYNVSYENCPYSGKATWFIDPPYQHAGQHYHYGSDRIDYDDLSVWSRERQGQLIVCENAGATWLPFRHVATVKTTRAGLRSPEVVWIRDSEAP